MVSGGFDPIHVGHIRLIREASKYGDVIVEGFNSIGFKERREFLMSIKGVVEVVSVCDEDDTVCAALIEHKPTYFANGGPRNEENTPEKIVCEELGIKMLWDIGSKWRFPK
jgi:D-beta-D-heptose 7-phosphate kinase/D-beta-D-heptose 1-phosphate adenosyltransferase